jgi:hypothetical protein
VTGFNQEVTVAVHSLGTSCIYGTTAGGTDLGTAVSGTTTKDAELVLNAKLPLIKTAAGFGCANPAEWIGTYKVTKPTPLIFD